MLPLPGSGVARSVLGLITAELRQTWPADIGDRTWVGKQVSGTEGPPRNRRCWKGQSSDGAPAFDCGKEGSPLDPVITLCACGLFSPEDLKTFSGVNYTSKRSDAAGIIRPISELGHLRPIKMSRHA